MFKVLIAFVFLFTSNVAIGAELTPVRAPVYGSCECPYDKKTNGRACGKSSAFSRAGGRSAICYQTNEPVKVIQSKRTPKISNDAIEVSVMCAAFYHVINTVLSNAAGADNSSVYKKAANEAADRSGYFFSKAQRSLSSEPLWSDDAIWENFEYNIERIGGKKNVKEERAICDKIDS